MATRPYKPRQPANDYQNEKRGPHGYFLTDVGTAQYFAFLHRDTVRYCQAQKRWYCWTGRRWEPDDTGAVYRLIKAAIVGLLEYASSIRDFGKQQEFIDWVVGQQSAKAIKAVHELAKSELELVIRPDDFNSDPFLLNCWNGTIDLKTGTIREHRREDYCLQITNAEYDPEASCDTWLATLDSIFCGNADMVAFMQRVAGMALTGDVSEHILLLFWGTGSNGKSILIETLLDLLGDYAAKGADDLLLALKSDTHPTIKASLFGKRLVAVVESAEGARLNESLVKELTGGDTITARRLYENYWSFRPTHKLILCTNHKPMIKGTDDGIWRRTKLVEFRQRFWDADRGETGPEHLRADKRLTEKLRAERNGILAWAVRGCLDWLQTGLRPPECVTAATSAYKQSQDVIGQWIEDCCYIQGSNTVRAKAGDLYQSYKEWAEAAGEKPVSQRRFGESMRQRGFERVVSGGKWWAGIGLLSK